MTDVQDQYMHVWKDPSTEYFVFFVSAIPDNWNVLMYLNPRVAKKLYSKYMLKALFLMSVRSWCAIYVAEPDRAKR